MATEERGADAAASHEPNRLHRPLALRDVDGLDALLGSTPRAPTYERPPGSLRPGALSGLVALPAALVGIAVALDVQGSDWLYLLASLLPFVLGYGGSLYLAQRAALQRDAALRLGALRWARPEWVAGGRVTLTFEGGQERTTVRQEPWALADGDGSLAALVAPQGVRLAAYFALVAELGSAPGDVQALLADEDRFRFGCVYGPDTGFEALAGLVLDRTADPAVRPRALRYLTRRAPPERLNAIARDALAQTRLDDELAGEALATLGAVAPREVADELAERHAALPSDHALAPVLEAAIGAIRARAGDVPVGALAVTPPGEGGGVSVVGGEGDATSS